MSTILVVDDDAAILSLLTTVLRDESGHTVISAANGREALDMLQQQPIDAVVCDANMPVMNGVELVRAIRSDDALAGIPVVMISAMAYPEDLDPDLEIDLMLEKPFEISALIACVSYVLGRVRASRNSIRVTRRRATTSVSRIVHSSRRSTGVGEPATS